MAFFKFISDMMKKGSQSNKNLIGEIVKSSPGDIYDVKSPYGIIVGIGIIYPGGVTQPTISFGTIGRVTYYKNLYKVGDVVNLVKILGNDSILRISGKLDFLANQSSTNFIDA